MKKEETNTNKVQPKVENTKEPKELTTVEKFEKLIEQIELEIKKKEAELNQLVGLKVGYENSLSLIKEKK